MQFISSRNKKLVRLKEQDVRLDDFMMQLAAHTPVLPSIFLNKETAAAAGGGGGGGGGGGDVHSHRSSLCYDSGAMTAQVTYSLCFATISSILILLACKAACWNRS